MDVVFNSIAGLEIEANVSSGARKQRLMPIIQFKCVGLADVCFADADDGSMGMFEGMAGSTETTTDEGERIFFLDTRRTVLSIGMDLSCQAG